MAPATKPKQLPFRELLDDRDHLRGCPVAEGGEGRVEAHSDVRPADPVKGTPSADVTVVRCVECGGSTAIDEPYETAVQRLSKGDTKTDETEA